MLLHVLFCVRAASWSTRGKHCGEHHSGFWSLTPCSSDASRCLSIHGHIGFPTEDTSTLNAKA
jgi:hypothetical protein